MNLAGGVILLASLFWEGENPATDGEGGLKRKNWTSPVSGDTY
jgi:hypothetical protein